MNEEHLNVARLGEIYDARQEIHELALRDIWENISVVLHAFSGEGGLFQVPHKIDRIKPLLSLQKKAFDRQIVDATRVFEEIQDILGIRLITNNLKDVWELHDRIRLISHLEYDHNSFQDYITTPKDSGYRAVHFVVHGVVDRGGRRWKIPCEIQIRTLLQDSWGEITHADIYKNAPDLPVIISKLSQRLADQLAVLDNIAQDIRDALSSQLIASDVADDMPIDKGGLAKIYEDRFDSSLIDYQAQGWMTTLSELSATTIGEAKQLFPSQRVIDRMREIYDEVWNRRNMPHYHILVYGPKIMFDPPRGYEHFRTEITNELNANLQIGSYEFAP